MKIHDMENEMPENEFENVAHEPPAVPSRNLTLSTADYAETMKIAEEIGKVKMAQSISSGLSLAVIRWFASMKDSGIYKKMPIVNFRGELFYPQTFDELCEGMGFSKASIYEKLQNFAVFGERFLEEAQQMGLKVRDLRKIRKALKDATPEQSEELMFNLRRARDSSEDLHTTIDVLCAQYSSSKEKIKKLEGEIKKLEEDRQNLKEDYRAQSETLKARNAQYDEVREKLIRATSPTPADQKMTRMEWMQNAKREVDDFCLTATLAMSKMGEFAEFVMHADKADAALKLYINDRLNVTIRDIGAILREKDLDIDFDSEFRAPEFMYLNSREEEHSGQED